MEWKCIAEKCQVDCPAVRKTVNQSARELAEGHDQPAGNAQQKQSEHGLPLGKAYFGKVGSVRVRPPGEPQHKRHNEKDDDAVLFNTFTQKSKSGEVRGNLRG